MGKEQSPMEEIKREMSELSDRIDRFEEKKMIMGRVGRISELVEINNSFLDIAKKFIREAEKC